MDYCLVDLLLLNLLLKVVITKDNNKRSRVLHQLCTNIKNPYGEKILTQLLYKLKQK